MSRVIDILIFLRVFLLIILWAEKLCCCGGLSEGVRQGLRLILKHRARLGRRRRRLQPFTPRHALLLNNPAAF